MFDSYKAKLTQAIKKHLSITFDDCMDDECLKIFYVDQWPINEVVEWIANKYDLIITN